MITCDSELFYNGLVAVRVGATDWYLPDGGPWPRLYFNSKYMFIDRSGKTVSSSRYDEVSHENDRWFGCHGTTEYLLDSNGNEREQANYCYVPSTWAENIVEQAEKDGLRLSYHTPYRLNIHRDEFCELAWQTIQTVNPNINLPELAQPFSDCDEDIVRQIASLGIVTGYEDGATAVQALMNGQADCVVIDNAPAQEYVKANPGLKILDTEFANEDYAIGVAKGNTALQDALNTALAELQADGTIQSIIDKYIPAEAE